MRAMACFPTVGRSPRFFAVFHEYLSLDSVCQARKANRLASLLYGNRYYSNSTPEREKTSLSPPTYYELFPATLPSGPPPDGPFKIDARELRKEFLKLQAQAHPDRHQGENKARAEGTSALINEAYKTLQNPLLRAQYLLSLRGIDVAEDETARVEDPELLMEVLEMREDIEAAEEEADLAPMKEANDAKIEASVKVIEDAFKADDMVAAKEEAVKLRYWINIKESLDGWEKGKPVVLVH